LAQLFVIVAAQTDLEGIELLVAQTSEVFRAPAGMQNGIPHQGVKLFEIVDVSLADERGHFLIGIRLDPRRHGIEGFGDLLVRHRLRAAVAEHRGGERGPARFIDRFGGGAGGEDQTNGNERALARQFHYARLRAQRRRKEETSDDGAYHLAPPSCVRVTTSRFLSIRYFFATRWISAGVSFENMS